MAEETALQGRKEPAQADAGETRGAKYLLSLRLAWQQRPRPLYFNGHWTATWQCRVHISSPLRMSSSLVPSRFPIRRHSNDPSAALYLADFNILSPPPGRPPIQKHCLTHQASTAVPRTNNLIAKKRSKRCARAAEEKYRSIFENAVEGIFQTTAEGKYLSANPKLAQIYGYDSPLELMSELCDIQQQLYVDPQRRKDFRDLLESTDTVKDFESQVYRRDGQIIWISENARAVRDAAGKLLHYEGTVEDITQRKQADELHSQKEEALAASRAKSEFLAT